MNRNWKLTDRHPIPQGESVLCWDGINKIMFVAYLSGDTLVTEPPSKDSHTPFEADYWRELPEPPK